MRLEHTLPYMVIISLFLHVCFLGISAMALRKKYPLYVPKSIAVRIITPVKKEAAGPPGAAVTPPVEKKKEAAGPPPRDKKAKPVVKEPAVAKPGVSKEERAMVEDRVHALKAKKRVEEITRLRSIVDISTRGVAERARERREGIEGEPGAVPGTAGPAAGEETEEGMLNAYIDVISMQIRREWIYPELLIKEGLEAVVAVRIGKDGDVKILGVEKSSNNSLFDRSVIRAIMKASPVQRPPHAMEIGLRFHP